MHVVPPSWQRYEDLLAGGVTDWGWPVQKCENRWCIAFAGTTAVHAAHPRSLNGDLEARRGVDACAERIGRLAKP